MGQLDEKKLEIAEAYVEELVKLKLANRTSVGCLIVGILLGGGAAALVAAIPELSFILGPIAFAAPITLGVCSVIAKVMAEKMYGEVAEKCDISKKELKSMIKSGEMQKCLKHIFSEDYTPGVEQIARLSDTLNGRNPNYKSSNGIVESIRREVYGKDAKEQKKNSNKR